MPRNQPKKSTKPKNQKSAKKASRTRDRDPSPSSGSDFGGDQVQTHDAGGQAATSPTPDSRSRASSPDSRSRASSNSRSRASSHSHSHSRSRARTPTHEEVVNDDFSEVELSSSDGSSQVGSPQADSPHPQSKDSEVQLHPQSKDSEVQLHPRQEVFSNPPREVHSPSRRSESDDSEVQCLGHIEAPVIEAEIFSEISRANPAPTESVTILQRVSGSPPVNVEESSLPLVAKQDAPPANLFGGENAPNEPKNKNKKAKAAAGPSSSANIAEDRGDPAKNEGQRASDAAKPAEERKEKPENKKTIKRTKLSDGPIRDTSREDVANLLSMVKNLKEQVEGTNAKLMKQAQAAILSEERYREMRERELTEEDARATAQADEIARLQSELEEAAAKQHEAPSKFLQLDDPEFAVRFESLMKTGLYSLENVRAALETTKQDGKYSSTRADAYLKAILVAQRNDVLQRANLN